jgi:acetyl esterase/lipase
MAGVLRWTVRAVLLALALAAAAFFVSPWPSALVVRAFFERGAAAASDGLARHVPPGVRERLGVTYDPADPDALLDVFLPPLHVDGPTPVLVWVHGGGFVSGSRADVGNYLRVLAGRGVAGVAVGYSIAPEATYPTPVRQANAALGFLLREGAALGLDPERLILAGDSAGALVAAQVANLTTAPAYAADIGVPARVAPGRVRGVVLFCGPYDLALLRFEGAAGLVLRAALWAYGGRRDVAETPMGETLSVARRLTGAFPPAFVSAGNADPLLPHSLELARRLREAGVPVDELFFSADHAPALGHEYQFDLDGEAGRAALDRVVAFARRVTAEP